MKTRPAKRSKIKFSKTADNRTINLTAYFKAGPNRQKYRHPKTTKATGQESNRGGSKLEGQELNLPRDNNIGKQLRY